MSLPKSKDQCEDEPILDQKTKTREYRKRWRGIQFFVRFESRTITRTLRSQSAPDIKPADTNLRLATAAANAPPNDPPPSPPEETETQTDWMVACGVMPPNTTSGPPVG